MAYVSGTAGSVSYVSGGTTVVGGAHEWSLDLGQETPEVTAFGENWRAFIPGIREWSGSLSAHLDPANAGQTFVRNALIGGSVGIEFRFAAGSNYYSGSALITGASPGIAYDGAATLDFDLQGTGALAFT